MLNALALKLIAGVGAILLLVILIQDRNHWKAKSASLTAQIAADRKAYESAQREAKARNIAQVQKIEAQHEAITDRVKSDYSRDLERLRQQANRGSTSRPGVSGVPKAPGGVNADGVPDASCDHLCAQEIELRLMHLQNWIREQATIQE